MSFLNEVLNFTDSLTILECGVCHISHAIPKSMYNKAKMDGSFWYCPNGHHIHFTRTENQELKEALERAKRDNESYSQRNTELHNRLTEKNHIIRAEKGAKTKLKKRIANGVCPCCNRSFHNLARHMNNQHPDFAKQ